MAMKIHNTYYTIPNQKTKKRIILIGDIHYYKNIKPKLFTSLILKINQLKPDYICIAGDLIDHADAKKNTNMVYLYSFLEELSTIAPLIIVFGNHDIRVFKEKWIYKVDQELVKKLKEMPNVHFLENESVSFPDFFFMGYNAPFSYYQTKEKNQDLLIKDAKEKLKSNQEKISILLCHTPIGLMNHYFEPLKLNRYSCILCGHTHNGMVPSFIKKGNWGIVSPAKKWFPKYIRGHMQKENTNLIITGGVTKLSYSSGLFRYFNWIYSPEITVIDFQQKKG